MKRIATRICVNREAAVLLVLLCTISLPNIATADDAFRASQAHMGTRFSITLYAENEEAARAAFEAAFDRIERLDNRLSDYQADSELNRLCRQSPTPRPVQISSDLFAVLSAAEAISRQSEGAFDVTVGPMTRLWRSARRKRELPSEELLAKARKAVGYRYVMLSERDGMYFAKLTQADMQLDLGGIAKGYALDQAIATLHEQGVDSVLIDGGGDLALGAAPPGREGWRIGIAPLEANAPPSQQLTIARRGIATSGDAWQYIEIDGRRYSHIVDPATGLGLQQRSSVTVIAPTGMQADALASAVSVLGPVKGVELIDQIDEVEAIVVTSDDGRVKQHRSKGIEAILRGRAGE